MEVKKINPQGYCKGVILALKRCIKTINNPKTKKPIYLLGMIIHNKLVCDELKKLGITILEGNDKLALLDQINEGTVIVSAHGVSKKVIDTALSKNIPLIDTTCPDVKKVHDEALRYINNGYEVLYIGKTNHPETIGVLEESDKIHLIDSIDIVKKIDKTKKYYVTNQTTLSHSYIETFHKEILNENIEAIIENNICLATTKREMALYDIKTDLIVVVGDFNSSNTKKLVQVAKEKALAKAVIAIEKAVDLLNYDLTIYDEAYVTSGASTPSVIVEQTVRFLESNGQDIKILDEQLLFF